MEENIKVKLKADLTRYARGLIVGTEGYTIGSQGMWSRGSDRFITVKFSDIATLDVLWESLEIIDEKVIKENEKYNNNFKESLRTARNVELHLGPQGGFRHLLVEYIDKETGTETRASYGLRTKAYKIIDILKGYNISIKEIKER